MSSKTAVKKIFKQYGITFVLIALCILFTILNPVFLTLRNIMNVMRQMSMIGIASVGGMLVIIQGGIDLSEGAVVSSIKLGSPLICLENTGLNWMQTSVLCHLFLG